MSFLTRLLETTVHFGNAIEQLEQKLVTSNAENTERIKSLVQLAYCYAHVQLQKGLAVADQAINLAEKFDNSQMKGHALCAKAMNQFRIGYTAQAKSTVEQALSIFENINDEEGKCDACFQLGSISDFGAGPGDSTGYLEEALNRYKALGNATGIYLVRIQQTIQLFYLTRFEKGECEIKALIEKLSAPQHRHLLCFANMQLSIGMYIKQDVVQFMNTMLEWQRLAEANGNFHDYTMTKAMLPDCYRLQHLDKDVMQACLDSMECTRKLGSFYGHCTVSIVMANICSKQGQFEDALLYYHKAIAAAREIDHGYQYLMALNAMGEVYLELGQIAKAREAFETAKREASFSKDRLNLIAAHRHLAELAYQQGEYDLALFDFKNLFDAANNSDGWHMQDHGNYASSIARASDDALKQVGINPKDRHTLRLRYLEEYLELTRNQQNKHEEAKALNALAEYFEEINDLGQAIQNLKNYIQLYQELVSEESFKSITDLRMQYETEMKEQELELLKKESEQALLNERLRISRELHDDVGATLSGIAMYSHLTKEQMKTGQTAEIEKSLNTMQQSSAQMVDKLNDMVWLINPEKDSLQKLIDRLEEYATDMSAVKSMKVKINAPDKIAEISLPIGSRRNIYLLCKEAINNAVKYSQGSVLELTVKEVDNRLEFSVSDNGKGFDAVMVRRGNGLENMQKRADEIGAKLVLTSKENEGTSLSLRCKITQ